MSEPKGTAPPGYLSSEQVADALGVPYRSLMRWVEDGLVIPFAAGRRRRAPRLWSERHLREAGLIKNLRDHGLSTQAVKRAMECLRSNGHDPLSAGQFLILNQGADVLDLVGDGAPFSAVKHLGQALLLVVDLEEIAKANTLPAE